jgi:hypothetical protein
MKSGWIDRLNWKRDCGVLAAGLAAGFAMAALVFRDGGPHAPGLQSVSGDPDVRESTGIAPAVQRDSHGTPVDSDIQALRQQATANPGLPRRPMTSNEQIAQNNALMERYEAAVEERDIQLLLAAGYAPDRIEWLKNRSEELKEQRRREETERLKRGLPVHQGLMEMAYLHDGDIELRYEIGDDEYEKYLHALDRPASVGVVSVLPGSIADSVGIKPGDQIISYGNKRIFNAGELDAMAMEKRGTVGSSMVTVRREGQLLHFEVPAGLLGVRSPVPVVDVSKIRRNLAEKATP